MNVLNLWKVNRRTKINGGDLDAALGQTANEFPFIVIDNACPGCFGQEVADKAMLDLIEKMGGNPWSAETYSEEGQA